MPRSHRTLLCGRFRGYDVRPQSSVPDAMDNRPGQSMLLPTEDDCNESELGKPDRATLQFSYDQVYFLAVTAPPSKLCRVYKGCWEPQVHTVMRTWAANALCADIHVCC